ncbi:hypothetical protein DYBT9623_00450 [Dyadobacter sp. CECT 9623]|uniref:DoxX-like family protein n=1 Tax=Dyadobacter linearis TaxID=2823330 RepID=A0ABM8UJX7_9BACT|nr:DoxX family protein [Dyadobacter sp. CECT 9623]CAG5067728.1 hypothetical protein DYBT9623_00450 [Dyadobacter sp. CECT 9623]
MKAKKIITIVVTALASAMVVFSGVMKLMGSDEVVATMSKMGVADHTVTLGLMEIGFTALFLYPKTMKMGFILLTCYFAGALATELSHASPLNAITPLALVWIAAFLRDKYIFLPSEELAVK